MKKYYFLIIVTLILGLVLTGCLSNISQVPATNQSGITYLTKGGPTEAEAESFPLYAGQDWLVGEVLVWDDGMKVCVKYVLDPAIFADGWGLTETHLAVGATLEDIPTNKSGNPKVGKFPYGNDELGGVAEDGPYCIDFGEEEGELDVVCGAELFIAAHAVIEKEECIPGDSGTDTYVSDDTTLVTAGNVVSALYPYAAVPTDAGPHYGANTWINQTSSNIWAPGALWIWESNPVVKPILGDIVWFEKTFNVTGTPTAGELKIAVDNGYAVWLNGKFVGKDNLFQFVGADDVYDTATLGDLKQAYVDTTTWQTVGIFDLTSYLQTGTNTLKILGVNEYMNSDDGGQPVGTEELNPGGMAFQFTVDWEVPEVCTTYDETAWAANDEIEGDEEGTIQFVDSKSWATYFNYTVTCPENLCIDFTKLDLNPGNSIEGADTVYIGLDIDAVGGNAVFLMPDVATDATYGAPNGVGSIKNGCMDTTGGFADVARIHHYVFTFDGKSVNEFSLRMLDFGDYNPDRVTHHLVTMTAYSDMAGTVEVDTDVLDYSSDNLPNPRSSTEYGDLYYTGDACDAEEGEPGNWTWEVSGTGIVRIELLVLEGRDPNIAFDKLCFTIEQH